MILMVLAKPGVVGPLVVLVEAGVQVLGTWVALVE